ncbi:unnamed protein product, partial [Owenia fusiformis]
AAIKNMCILKNLQFFRTLPKLTLYPQCASFSTKPDIPRILRIRQICMGCRNYSGTKSQSGSLTDDILKQKFTQESSKDSPENDEKQSKKGSKGKRFENWTGKNAWKLGLVFMSGWSIMTGGYMFYLWGSPKRDENGQIIQDEFMKLPTMEQYFRRAINEFEFFKKMIKEPTSEKLLPDPLKEPYYQPPYTLVLEMTGVLVHPDWTLNTGWRFQKRPGVAYFLQQVGPPLFEVVIYTAENGFTAFPIIDGLDQEGYIMYRLFRDATRYMDGHHVKDLSCLNRDLKKVIFVDCNPKSYELQPRNAIGLKKWTGDNEDRTLIDLATMLRMIGTSGVEDVRTVLDYYNQFDDPVAAFKINQEKLKEEQNKKLQELQDQKSKQTQLGGLSKGLFGSRR